MMNDLKKVILDNLNFYQSVSSTKWKFCQSFHDLVIAVEKIDLIEKEIEKIAENYDYDKETRANGYRSWINIKNKALSHLLKICYEVKEKRENLFFRKSFHFK